MRVTERAEYPAVMQLSSPVKHLELNARGWYVTVLMSQQYFMYLLQWDEKRVFYMTPQTLMSDLTSDNCDPGRIVLLVIGEAYFSPKPTERRHRLIGLCC